MDTWYYMEAESQTLDWNLHSIRKPNFGSLSLIYDRILPFLVLRMCES